MKVKKIFIEKVGINEDSITRVSVFLSLHASRWWLYHRTRKLQNWDRIFCFSRQFAFWMVFIIRQRFYSEWQYLQSRQIYWPLSAHIKPNNRQRNQINRERERVASKPTHSLASPYWFLIRSATCKASICMTVKLGHEKKKQQGNVDGRVWN